MRRPEVCIALVTAPSGDAARRLARSLVETECAACVNVIAGVHSVFRWQGAVEEAAEDLLVIKTTADAVSRLRDKVEDLHDYDVPEFLVLTVRDGAPDYLNWLADSVGSAGDEG